MKTFYAITVLLLLVAFGLALTGCGTHNQLSIAPDGQINQTTSPASVASMNGDGRLSAAYHGIAPGQIMQDDGGTWMQVPGIPSGITLSPDGRLFLATPQDVSLEGVEYTPAPAAGQPALKVGKLTMRSTEPLGQNVQAFVTAAAALQGLTQTEAAARVAQLQAAGAITTDLAGLLSTIIVPLLAP